MRERTVGFRHTVGVFALLHGIAAVVRGIEQLGGETLDHRLVIAAAGGLDDPTDGEGLTALGANLDRNLVGRTADAAGTNLDRRSDVVEGLLEDFERVRLGAALDAVEGTVDDALGSGLLTVVHDGIHELRDDDITELGVRDDLTLFGAMAAGHELAPTSNTVDGLLRPLRAVLRTTLLTIL